jgi:hypothetical protein
MQMKVDIPLGQTESVAAEWKVFCQKIFAGARPSEIQLKEMRKA